MKNKNNPDQDKKPVEKINYYPEATVQCACGATFNGTICTACAASTQAIGEAAEIIDIVRLSEKKDMPAGDLEEISLKRLELARVLATNPTLLMIDEVAAGLTEAEIPQVLDILREIHEMSITIILIEHVMKVMMKAVGRIIVMDEGMKIADGTPNEVMDNKKVIEAYFGSYIDRSDSK